MGWWDAGDGLLGGDAPLDAFGGAMDRATKRFQKTVKRRPLLFEVVHAFDAVAPRAPSSTYDALVAALDGEAPLVSKRPPPLLTGELLAIPYGEGRAMVALVLFGDEHKKKGPGYGPCLVVLELEAGELGSGDARSLDRARTARWLTQPFHPGSQFAAARLGRVSLVPDASFLPCFVWHMIPGSTSRSATGSTHTRRYVFDYFDADVTDQPGVDARVIENSVGGSGLLVVGVRIALGLNRALPWLLVTPRADAPKTPLAHLPSFVLERPKKPKKQAPPKPADAALITALETTLAEALAECRRAWNDAADRDPTREELARALRAVLSASARELLADPTRTEKLPSPSPRPPTAEAVASYHYDKNGDVDVIRVDGRRPGWAAFPFREGGALIVETLYAPSDVIAHLPAILRTWRDARSLPHEPEPVLVRAMNWDGSFRTTA